MTRGLGRRSGAAAVLLAALVVAVPASPAAADVVVTIDQPKPDAVLESSSVTVSGKASGAVLSTIKRVTVALKGRPPVTIDCTDTPCPFSTQFSIPANGPNEVTVSATEVLLGLDGATGSQVRKFAVEAPPARPVLDQPKVTDTGAVQLSWSRNTESDMLYYVVFRKDPGGKDPVAVSTRLAQPASGAKVTFTDLTTSGTAGGDYAYQVAAVRKGRSGTADTEAKSASASGTAAVPVPTTTSTTAAAAGTAPSTGPTPTVKAAPPAGVDLSGFLSSRSQPIALPPITVPEPPDTGFKGTLPFGARPPGDDIEEGPADAVPPSGRRTSSVISQATRSRPLVPVAGGLVLLLVAIHMRMLNRKVKAPVDRDLPVDRVASAARAEPRPAEPPPRPVATITPVPYDVLDEEDWDAEWAAAVAELDPVREPDPEPEPEPETEPEPEPEPEPAIVTLWAPPDAPSDDDEPDVDPDEIEVFEVVSPVPRRLVRAGRS